MAQKSDILYLEGPLSKNKFVIFLTVIINILENVDFLRLRKMVLRVTF